MASMNVCRICLKIRSSTYSIYRDNENENPAWIIYCISGVKISCAKEPTARICGHCLSLIKAARNTIYLCQRSQKHFDVTENTCASKTGESNLIEPQLHNPTADQVLIKKIDKSINFSPTKDLLKESSYLNSQNTQLQIVAKETVQFECDDCHLNFKTGKQLIAHRLEIHNINDPKIYKCSYCPLRFSWKPKLYRHIQEEHKIDPIEKKFKCIKCNKRYLTKLHLKEHLKQQHEPRQYKCVDPNCERTFARAFTLRRHYLAIHSTRPKYHCTDCGKYFKVYDLWKYHNEIVHRNETVYCPKCGFPFRKKAKLEEHLLKDICKKSIIPCFYCQRRFTTNIGLRDHLKKIHKVKHAN